MRINITLIFKLDIKSNIFGRKSLATLCGVFLLFFLGPHPRCMEAPRLGGQSSATAACQPMPQPQQLGILAGSATYITAHCNARSFTHWSRTGIQPPTSGLRVRFVSAVPQWELLLLLFLKKQKSVCGRGQW